MQERVILISYFTQNTVDILVLFLKKYVRLKNQIAVYQTISSLPHFLRNSFTFEK